LAKLTDLQLPGNTIIG